MGDVGAGIQAGRPAQRAAPPGHAAALETAAIAVIPTARAALLAGPAVPAGAAPPVEVPRAGAVRALRAAQPVEVRPRAGAVPAARAAQPVEVLPRAGAPPPAGAALRAGVPPAVKMPPAEVAPLAVAVRLVVALASVALAETALIAPRKVEPAQPAAAIAVTRKAAADPPAVTATSPVGQVAAGQPAMPAHGAAARGAAKKAAADPPAALSGPDQPGRAPVRSLETGSASRPAPATGGSQKPARPRRPATGRPELAGRPNTAKDSERAPTGSRQAVSDATINQRPRETGQRLRGAAQPACGANQPPRGAIADRRPRAGTAIVTTADLRVASRATPAATGGPPAGRPSPTTRAPGDPGRAGVPSCGCRPMPTPDCWSRRCAPSCVH